MIELEIDGKKCLGQPGQMIIDVADANDIYIPRFCYHRKLSIAANCRMCLVEVEKNRKPVPACATPAADGLKVYTKSKLALDAQKAVMEFLLINHPLDCPICDQGGECELQDLAVGFGGDVSKYTEEKRVVADEDLGPLVETDMTRCIHCTRCVRFGDEIAGLRELGAVNRGENTRIGTYVKKAMVSEVSANIIDLCPVGALTNKPFRYKARAWEMSQHASVAPHDCVGSNIYLHTRGNEYTDYRDIMRVVPRDNEAINENWISDRDRFSVEALSSDERATHPMIKQDGEWQTVDWPTALNTVVDRLRTFQGTDIAGLASPNSTVEALYLFQKWLRGIGCPNIDHRLRQTDFSQQDAMPVYPGMAMHFAELDHLQAAFLVGSDLRREQPIANLRLRKAMIEHEGHAFALNPRAYPFNYPVTQSVCGSDDFVAQLATVAQAVAQKTKQTLDPAIVKLAGEVRDFDVAVAANLVDASHSALFLGAYAQNHPQAHTLFAIAQAIASLSGAKLCVMTEGANAAGAWLAGVLPHRGPAADRPEKTGDHTQQMFSKSTRAFVLMNVEPELDCADSAGAKKALNDAEFVVCISPFMTGAKQDYADVILPIGGFAHAFGTFINAEGRWQSFQAAGPCYGEARPAWKVLRVLANLFNLDGFEHESPKDILAELHSLTDDVPEITSVPVAQASEDKAEVRLLLEWPMFAVDNVVRRSVPLAQTLPDNLAAFRMNSATAKRFNCQEGDSITGVQGEHQLTLPWVLDESLPEHTVHLFAGLSQSAGFGTAFAPITIKRS